MNFECDMMLNSDTMDFASSTSTSLRNQQIHQQQQQQQQQQKLINSHSDSSVSPLYNEFNSSNAYDRSLNSQISRNGSALLNSNSSTTSLNGRDDDDDNDTDDSIDCDNGNSGYSLNPMQRGSFLPSFNRVCLGNTDNDKVSSTSIGSGYFNNSNYNQEFLNSMNKFQYTLMAPTSPAVKVNEDTLTYLNQGQSYELKFNRIDLNKPVLNNRQGKKYDNDNDYKDFLKEESNINEQDNEYMYLSTVRLCFWDRKLQEVEHDEIREWEKEYHLARMLEVDNNLSFGAFDVRVSNVYTNAIEIIWNGKTGSSIFFKCNCTSTAFSKNKHGGEKGVHMRLQIDTFQVTNPSVILGGLKAKQNENEAKLSPDTNNNDENNSNWWKHLCSSYCRIQLFRLKGAQRKLKTDRLKIERSNPPDLKRRYQISEPVTVLYNCAFDSLYSMLPLDRDELHLRQKQQLQIKQELIDPIVTSNNNNNNNCMPPTTDSLKAGFSAANFNSTPAFFCENELNNTNNAAISESLQFYVENSNFALNENSKFSLMIDDISAIIDETPDDNLFMGLNSSLPSSRRNSLFNQLVLPTTKSRAEQDHLNIDPVYQTTNNRPLFPTSASLPQDLSQLASNKQLTTMQLSTIKNPTPTTPPTTTVSIINSPLVNDATSVYVQQWLTTNRFSHLLPIFKNYTSNDFLRLSKDDLIKLCGAPDAIRCFNLAHNIQICPRLTMFVKFNQQNYFYAIYLNECKCKYLIKKLMQFYNGQLNNNNKQQQQPSIVNSNETTTVVISNQNTDNTELFENYELFIKSKGIIIKMTDEVLNNIRDETKFLVEYTRQEMTDNIDSTTILITLIPLD